MKGGENSQFDASWKREVIPLATFLAVIVVPTFQTSISFGTEEAKILFEISSSRANTPSVLNLVRIEAFGAIFLFVIAVDLDTEIHFYETAFFETSLTFAGWRR